ncbi:reverse transcriptase domain-containing protein [Tanacetum coccineum]
MGGNNQIDVNKEGVRFENGDVMDDVVEYGGGSPTVCEIPESCLPLGRGLVLFLRPLFTRSGDLQAGPVQLGNDVPSIPREDPYVVAREDLYKFVDMVDDAPRHPGCPISRELDYGITDEWDGLYRDRPIHHHLAVMVEREAWMAREAWGFSMDVSDDARSHVLALRTTVVEQRALISGLQAADHQRQVQLTMALQLLKGLQTQWLSFRGSRDPQKPVKYYGLFPASRRKWHQEGVEFTYALRFQFETTNNEAEYEALIAGLRIAEKMGVKNLEVNVDSKLVANQVNGTYIAKETDMVKYLEKVKALTNTFRAFSIKQVPRSKNKKADALSKMASTSFAHLSKQVLVEELKEKSVNEKEVLAVVEEEGDTWMTPIHEYLTDETLPAERKKARAIKRPSQANYVLREIHEGSCSMHAGTRSVVAKALRTGYYWPTMHKDARALIKACQECQVHKPVLRNPQEKLNPITSPWPFYKWGIDIAGPFPEGPGKCADLVFQERPYLIMGSNFEITPSDIAVIPAKIGMPTFRTAEVDITENDEALEINLDLIEEKQEQAAIREAKSKRQMEKYYNTKVRIQASSQET